MSKKNLVLALVLIALMFGFVGVQNASADAVLAPSFRTDGNLVTIVTAVNKNSVNTGANIHWMYRYDDPSTTDVNECYHNDFAAKVTANDFLSVDISNKISGGSLIPAGVDTTSGSFNIGSGWLGFLTMYNYAGAYPGIPGDENTLAAEIVLADITTGEVFSYRAPNDPLGQDEGNLDDMAYGAFSGGLAANTVMPTLMWHPTSVVTTQLYIMPVTDNVALHVPGIPGEDVLTVVVSLADFAGNPGFWYDINEGLHSTLIFPVVDCFALLDLADFFDPAAIPFIANGGWANIQQVAPIPFTVNVGTLAYKLETTSALGGSSSAWTSANRIDF